jgi:ParB family chromosome partitioning protein
MNSKRNNMKGFVYGEDQVGAEQNLPISAIVLPDYQPRLFFDERKLEELAQNIKSQGILTRLIVRRIAGTDKYELIAGGRRFRAAQKAGLSEVPVVVKKLADDEALAIALTENLQREDLNPLEETEGIIRLLALKTGKLQEAIPQMLTRMYNDSKRKSESEQNVLFTDEGQAIQVVFDELSTISWESFVSSRLSLLNLPRDILNPLREGKIEYTKAKAIARVKDEEQRTELLSEAIAQELSLSQIKERISELSSQEADTGLPLPQKSITDISSKLKKAQLWKKDPKKWRKAQTLLKKLEELLDEELDEIGDGRS